MWFYAVEGGDYDDDDDDDDESYEESDDDASDQGGDDDDVNSLKAELADLLKDQQQPVTTGRRKWYTTGLTIQFFFF